MAACVGFKPKKTYNGVLIDVKRAPEPLDVFWENLGYEYWELWQKRSLSILASLVVLGASFAAILGIKLLQVGSLGNY